MSFMRPVTLPKNVFKVAIAKYQLLAPVIRRKIVLRINVNISINAPTS
jgi:hypothetical protein